MSLSGHGILDAHAMHVSPRSVSLTEPCPKINSQPIQSDVTFGPDVALDDRT